jgi:hypothetical protein
LLLPITIFLSAFLLFQVQPMIARFILPWFGGGPAVWTNCMLFFQAMLLVGYAYAHWLGARRNAGLQAGLHSLLLAVSLVFLPIVPRAEIWKPAGLGDPSTQILLLLAAVIGAPYFLLSATTPLLQRWFHVTQPEQSPWRLYALSNAGSFLALFSYPFLIEPFLRLSTQAWTWSVLYTLFAVLCAWTAWKMRVSLSARSQGRLAEPAATTYESNGRLPLAHILMWLALSACGSLLLLGTTNQITEEIAVFPFLWVAPLSIYLLTFILTFESGRWYRRGIFGTLAGVLAPATCAVVTLSVAIPVWRQLAIYLASLFVTCMVCHGELARSRPSPRHLTAFYLTISAGGAIGGLFAAIVAPRIFTEFTEFLAALAGTCVLGFLAWMRSGALAQWTGRNFSVRVPLMAMMFGAVTSTVAAVNNRQSGLESRRNFYGILRVNEASDQNGRFRRITHGRIQHGFQYLDAGKKDRPTTYYGPHSGAALGIEAVNKRIASEGRRGARIAVVGLGAGTLAAWGRPGDTYRFYEINPEVVYLARKWFTFLQDSKAATGIVLGDARVQLERELSEGQTHDFDLIAVDAFTSDAIPVHLLTAECGDIYKQRLAPGGILALHISNRSLDLEPITRGLAKHLGWQARMVLVAPDLIEDNSYGESSSRWVLLTESAETFSNSKIRDTLVGWSSPRERSITWTDDFSSLWRIVK